jgi:hypothetical protein
MKTRSLFLAFSVVLASTSAGAANNWQVRCGADENPAHFHVNGHSARVVNNGPSPVQVWAHDAGSKAASPPEGTTPSRIAAGDAAAVTCSDCELGCVGGAPAGQVVTGTWSKLKK